MIDAKLNLPIDNDDEKFQRSLIRSSINLEKVLKNQYGNFVIRAVMENLLKSLDFVPTFPIKIVR